jgi:hypothetical protein
LFAYSYAVLAGTDYSDRFRGNLSTPNSARIPIVLDTQLFWLVVEYGSLLLWLHTFGERFRNSHRRKMKISERIKWTKKPTRIPTALSEITYDVGLGVIHVADGQLVGVAEVVWNFEVSGMNVLRKWLGYRTLRGAGKAASSVNPLDQIRPTKWEPEWCDELREIVHVLTETEELRPQGIKLLDQIMESDLIAADELPQPPDELRKPPSRDGENELFDSDNSD